MKKWRVRWCVGRRFQHRYYDDDYKAIKRHILNLKKFGIFGGAMLDFKVPKAGNMGYTGVNYLKVGGNDSLLGLVHNPHFLGKPKEYWKSLIEKAMSEIQNG